MLVRGRGRKEGGGGGVGCGWGRERARMTNGADLGGWDRGGSRGRKERGGVTRSSLGDLKLSVGFFNGVAVLGVGGVGTARWRWRGGW